MGGWEQAGLAADLAGYAGAAVVVVAYFLNQRGRLASADPRFPAMNLGGSLLIIASLVFHPNLPSIVIEAFWSAISLYGVGKSLRAAQRT